MSILTKSGLLSKKKKTNKTKLLLVEDDDGLTDDDNQNENASLLKRVNKNLSPTSYGSEVRSFSPAPEINRNINTPIVDAEFDSFSITTRDDNDEEEKSKFFSLLRQFFNILCDTSPKKHIIPDETRPNSKSKYRAKIKYFLQIFKTFVFLSYGLLCITLFSVFDEKEQIWTQTVISNQTLNRLKCSSNPDTASNLIEILRLKLNGPFSTDANEIKPNSKYVSIEVYGKKVNTNESIFQSSWKLYIKSADSIGQQEFSENSLFANVFKLSEEFAREELEFFVKTNVNEFMSLNFDCQKLSNYYENKIVFASILLMFIYVLIIFELCHRTLAAGLGALGGIR